MAIQIPLQKILPAIDRKDRDFYDTLSEEEKKAFSAFIMVQYCATVVRKSSDDPELEYGYLLSTNHYANKNLLNLSKHKKLQWLMLTASGLGAGEQWHKWIPLKPKLKNTKAPVKKKLMELFPIMKEDDIDVLTRHITKKELDQYVKAHGQK